MDHIYIIAEAGVNHNGKLELAKQLVDCAARAGADCVKFQTFHSEAVISKWAEKAEYQKASTGTLDSQLDMVKKLELSHAEFVELKRYCEQVGIAFLSTPFDLDSITFLDQLGVPFWKVPSGEVTNLPYLLAIAKTGRPVVLSTGMCDMEEVGVAVRVLQEHGTPCLSLLHCHTEYPTPCADVNLNAMATLRNAFGVAVGYSDHTIGITVPIAAAALGAVVIEKHVTLDRTMEGPDHSASLAPQELVEMVRAVRQVEQALGTGRKEPTPSEQKNRAIVRKSITAAQSIARGALLTQENLTTKRPGTGISPMRWFEVLGTRAVRDFLPDEEIEL